MTLIYKRKSNQPTLLHLFNDYIGEIMPFARRIETRSIKIPLVLLKSIEWSIYRWYKTPVRRFYGVKGNELIYMITSRCNERCSKCGIWKMPESDDEHIKVDEFLNCLNVLHNNLYQVTVTGGEPLLFKEDVLLIAKEAKKLNVPMMIVTNGYLISKDFLIQYSEYGHSLVISIDTLDRSKWSLFRKNSYDKVMSNLHLAQEILGDRLGIQSVLSKETADDIPKIRSFCKQLGISYSIQPYMDFGGSWHEMECRIENEKEVVCSARKNICIYPNGDVVKCFDHRRIKLAKEPLGNIANEHIISILCKKRSTEISRIMKSCNFPCKQLSCNIPPDTNRFEKN